MNDTAKDLVPPEDHGGLVKFEGSAVYELMEKAIDKGGEAAVAMETLFKLYERQRDYGARQSFNEALQRFQAKCPPVPRDAKAGYQTRSGGTVGYTYASLEAIASTVKPLLHEEGFTYSFDTALDRDYLTVEVVLRHRDGHAERAKFTLPVASSNPGMSPQQKVASALKFGKRYTLVSVLGIEIQAGDADPTGDEAGEGNPTLVDAAGAKRVRDAIKAARRSERKALDWVADRMGIPPEELNRVEDMPAVHAEALVKALQQAPTSGGAS